MTDDWGGSGANLLIHVVAAFFIVSVVIAWIALGAERVVQWLRRAKKKSDSN